MNAKSETVEEKAIEALYLAMQHDKEIVLLLDRIKNLEEKLDNIIEILSKPGLPPYNGV